MLEIGWAAREFTPTQPAMLHGQMYRRVAHTALDPLTVTALALADPQTGTCVVLASCDLVGIPEPLLTKVQVLLGERLPAIPGDHLIIHATHTHTSLVLTEGPYEHPGPPVMSSSECLDLVAGRIADAVVAAWDSRSPRLVGRAFGHAVVGHNRYACYADGSAAMYGKTDRDDFVWIGGYEDHSLDMLFIREPGGELAGVVVAIPCPSQVDEHHDQFSADYWHDVRTELRRRLGNHLLVYGICSPAGDQSPHFLLYGRQEEEMRQRRGVTERAEIARRVADAVEIALASPGPEPEGDCMLTHRAEQLALTPRPITREERDRAQAVYEEAVAKGEADGWWPERQRHIVEQFDEGREPAPFDSTVHVVRLGDIAIATSQFELFLDYGLRIKALSPAAQTVLIQLAGTGSYLPTERAVRAGGYGTVPASGGLGPDGGAELVSSTLKLIRSIF